MADNQRHLVDLTRGVPKKFVSTLGNAIELPTIPRVIQRALEMMSDANVDLRLVANLLSHDAAVSAKLMRLSSLAAFGGYIFGKDNVEQVCRLLGFSRLRKLLIAMGIMTASEPLLGEANYWGYWTAAATQANLAQHFAAETNSVNTEEAFTVGLVRGVGRIVLAHRLNDEYKHIFKAARRDAQTFYHAGERLGFNMDWISADILSAWGIKPTIVRVVEMWHQANIGSSLHRISLAANALASINSNTRLPGDFDDAPTGSLRSALTELNLPVDRLDYYLQLRQYEYGNAIELVGSSRQRE